MLAQAIELEKELASELDDSGGITAADSARDGAEGLGVECIDDGVGVCVVVLEEVEEVEAELKVLRFRELEGFDCREIVVDQARHTEGAGAR